MVPIVVGLGADPQIVFASMVVQSAENVQPAVLIAGCHAARESSFSLDQKSSLPQNHYMVKMKGRAAKRSPIVFNGWIVCMAFACFLALGQDRKATTAGAEAGWIELFNGTDLQGWSVKCKPADRDKPFWKVDKGSILADSIGYKGHDYVWLATDREFSDFVLQLEFQAYRDSPGNTGVQIRSRYDEASFWLNGPQIDINPPEPWRTGMMWDETRGNQRWIFPNLPNGTWVDQSMAKPARVFRYADEADAWNQLEITAVRTKIKAVLNGGTITDFDGAGLLDDSLHKGHRVGETGIIALQIHTGDQLRVRFRHIRIRPVARSDKP